MTCEEILKDISTLNFGALNEIVQTCHNTADSKGFWDQQEQSLDRRREIGMRLMLVVTEVAEAFEAIRESREDAIPFNFAEEIIDTLIRLFDLAFAYGIDVGKVLEHKMKLNAARPHKHGKCC